MSFADLEASRQRGDKIYLYRFYDVDNAEFNYTNHEFPVEYGGKTYTPIPITHGNISASGTLDKASLEVRMTLRSDLAEAFRIYPPSSVVNLILRQMQLEDPDQQAVVCWVGRVISSSRGDNQMTLGCEPISTSLKRAGLRKHYQFGCPHVLYGSRCAASKAEATVSDVVVAAISGSTITLTAGWIPTEWPVAKKSPDKFVGGMVVWTYPTESGPVETKRTILRIVGSNQVQMTGPATGMSIGDTVNLVLGCNHQLSDCRTVHNNAPNFGGCPFIPKKNPFGFSNQFY